MENKKIKISSVVLAGSYLYLTLPIIIFLLGWCRWYIGIPVSLIAAAALVLCMRENKWGRNSGTLEFAASDKGKVVLIAVVVLIWVCLSGVGGYMWQNLDHQWRNSIFELMVNEKWPVLGQVDSEGGMMSRGMVYYIGYWLPSAIFGKIFGLKMGYAMQYIWAVIGILLFYSLICIWRKKIMVWPLFVFMFFSGLDAVGAVFSQPGTLEVFGDMHLEAWAEHYQFSSITTQLFWVFNQAIPVWLACGLIFLFEKPKNMIFTWSLLMLSSTFPFVGLLPFVVYFMIRRSKWEKDNCNVVQVVQNCWRNWGSLQNILAGGSIGIISSFYLLGNNALPGNVRILQQGGGKAALLIILIMIAALALFIAIFWLTATVIMKGGGKVLRNAAFVILAAAVVFKIADLSYSDWQSPMFFWMNMTVFYFLEAGVFMFCLYPMVIDKQLFWLNAVWLYVIPLIIIGNSNDFCMRASIPGLFLIILWSIQAIDRKERTIRAYLLIALLLVGAITPFHEMKRSYMNTRSYYENLSVDYNMVYMGRNFSGSTDSFFWKHIAKPVKD